MSAHSATIREAEDAIKRRFAADGFCGTLEYDPDKVIETDRWWYIPYCWIGCNGFIVNKDDLYVNWLGSAIGRDLSFWGHDRGIYHALVDFTFADDTDTGLVAALLSRFKHMNPDEAGESPEEPEWYGKSEIQAAISDSFPTFSRQFVWYALPELKDACEKNGLQFSSVLSKEGW